MARMISTGSIPIAWTTLRICTCRDDSPAPPLPAVVVSVVVVPGAGIATAAVFSFTSAISVSPFMRPLRRHRP